MANQISLFFEKYQHLLSSSSASKDVIIQVLKEKTGIDIDREHIEIRNGTIFIQESPILKNELFIKKRLILKAIADRLGKDASGDLR